MASYTVNPHAVAHAEKLIRDGLYVLDSDWGEDQPGAKLVACVYRASEWRHKGVELAAHDLLQELDKAAGIT